MLADLGKGRIVKTGENFHMLWIAACIRVIGSLDKFHHRYLINGRKIDCEMERACSTGAGMPCSLPVAVNEFFDFHSTAKDSTTVVSNGVVDTWNLALGRFCDYYNRLGRCCAGSVACNNGNLGRIDKCANSQTAV